MDQILLLSESDNASTPVCLTVSGDFGGRVLMLELTTTSTEGESRLVIFPA